MNENIINSFLFHPRKSYQEITEKDVLVNIQNNVKIGIRCHLINNSYPTLIFFHGNGEIVCDYDDIAQIYNQNKINFIIADYRGYGFSNGTPNIQNTQSDAHVILDFILEYLHKNQYINKIILMGRSLGSTSVLELTKRYPNDFLGLIVESGFANEKPLLQLIRTTAEEIGFIKNAGFLNDEKISKYNGPTLIIHAEDDHIIPYNQAQLLYNNCPSKNKTLIPIPNANHNNILTKCPNIYFSEIKKFIESIIK